MRTVFLVLGLAIGLGCATAGKQHSAGECPESANLLCLTVKECATDSARGCLRCQCGPGGYVPSNAPANPGAPPIQR